VTNYDYIAELRFGEDGSIFASNDFAGYPETDHVAPFGDPGAPAASPDWGTAVRGSLVPNLHSHFAVWKVDLDIAGRRNEFRSIKAVVDGSGSSYAKKAQIETRMDREDPDHPLVASATSPGLWRVVNPDSKNPVNGAPRGYAVVIQSAPAVQTLPDNHPFTITGSFAKRHVAVARRKEEEPSATHVLDHYPVTEPLLSVDKFLEDREDLVGQDLVCWVSVGREHVTRAEDIPLVTNFGVRFALHPWNYNEENPAMKLPMIRQP